MSESTLVLASSSPRRAALLTELGFHFDVVAPEVDEAREPGEPASHMVVRLARAKALASASTGAVTLGVDTTVAIDGEPLGKPRDEADAVSMLLRLSGRRHDVMSGWAVAAGDATTSGVEVTGVAFRRVSRAEAAAYARSGEPMGKAGAYAIQGEGRQFVRDLHGSYTNVVGLPVEALVPALARAGITPASRT